MGGYVSLGFSKEESMEQIFFLKLGSWEQFLTKISVLY